MGFREEFLKATFGVRAAGCMTFFWLVGSEVAEWCFRNLSHQLSDQSGVSEGSYHPPPGWGTLAPSEQLKDMYQIILYTHTHTHTHTHMYISLEEELGLCLLNYCFLTAFALFLHSLTSLISNCLNLLFGSQGRPRRLKPFSTNKKWRTQRVLLGFNPPFALILLNPEGNRCQTRKGIKFGIERLIINSAEELSFRGTLFQLFFKIISIYWYF